MSTELGGILCFTCPCYWLGQTRHQLLVMPDAPSLMSSNDRGEDMLTTLELPPPLLRRYQVTTYTKQSLGRCRP